MALAAGVVVVAAALIGATGTVPTRRPDPVAGPVPDGGFPRPPAIERVPLSAGTPEVLGSSPTLFHLDIGDLSGLAYVSWSSRRDGHEELAVTMESDAEVLVEADRDPERLRPLGAATSAMTVGGKPALAAQVGGSHLVRWQPIPGIWAQVNAATDVQAAIEIAAKLRLDRTYRCAVPFRLDGVDSPQLRKCTTFYFADEDTGRWIPAGGAWFTVGDEDTEYQVAVGKVDPRVVLNDTVDGRAIEVVKQTEIRYPYDERTAYFWSFGTARPEYCDPWQPRSPRSPVRTSTPGLAVRSTRRVVPNPVSGRRRSVTG